MSENIKDQGYDDVISMGTEVHEAFENLMLKTPTVPSKREIEEAIVRASAMHSYAMAAIGAIEQYLEEKGVEVGVSYSRYNPQESAKLKGMHAFQMVDVPARLYHEVVVPGLREVCARWRIIIIPDRYTKVAADCRNLGGIFAIQLKKVPYSELEALHMRSREYMEGHDFKMNAHTHPSPKGPAVTPYRNPITGLGGKL